ncbi:RNA polymerase II transcriptional regulator [Malassezia pachydermatis]|uniref:Mediator of RNA polymerase II transcription subunit 21 n=1 Tax=Malassezia pachydermatis TaxID=77020 RepID=A0A0M9VQP4_9BASI|nr:hypothetical protein Malapachy_2204 [Malassezia pachydermatis]KOS15765.1 hypothetical protein Malapachy_2204 [Malassezia pachydermatis]
MEPITELEDSLDTLLKVMASAIAYLSRKSGHKQVNQEVPLTTLGNTEGLSEDVLASNREELIEDLISQAKDVEQRISDLSLASVKEDAQMEEIVSLEKELHAANQDYQQALDDANALSAKLRDVLMQLTQDRHTARQVLEQA